METDYGKILSDILERAHQFARIQLFKSGHKTLQPARLKSQRELRFQSAVPVAIFNFTNTLPVGTKHIYPSTIKNISVGDLKYDCSLFRFPGYILIRVQFQCKTNLNVHAALLL